jgi:hypothetical protein
MQKARHHAPRVGDQWKVESGKRKAPKGVSPFFPLSTFSFLLPSDLQPARSAMTVRRHTVSGSISLPSRGSFHLSLAVLSAIGGKEYLALDGGPPRFTQDYSCPALLGSQAGDQSLSPTRLSLPMARPSSRLRLVIGFVTPCHSSQFWQLDPTTPITQRLRPITRYGFRLFRFRSPLLTESLRFLFLGLLRCFSSPAYPRIPMYSVCGDPALPGPGFPIRAPPDQRVFAPPRRVSPLAAPFIGSLPQGIHHTPFIA